MLNCIVCSFLKQPFIHPESEDTLADAILDRIVHDSYTMLIDGAESMRKRKGITD